MLARQHYVHEHELKRGEGHPLWAILLTSAALHTALQTPCHAALMPGSVQAGGKISLAIFPPALFLFRWIGQRKVQSAAAVSKQSHRKLQAPSNGFAHSTEPHQRAFCDIGKHLCIKDRPCSRH